MLLLLFWWGGGENHSELHAPDRGIFHVVLHKRFPVMAPAVVEAETLQTEGCGFRV